MDIPTALTTPTQATACAAFAAFRELVQLKKEPGRTDREGANSSLVQDNAETICRVLSWYPINAYTHPRL
jgi:hypothetical protein